MISVIVCSVDPDQLEALMKNIEATISVPYELIAYDNRNTGRGICAVYNEGVKRAKYELLCFVHEDVRFLSADWGSVVQNIFANNSRCGLLGIAGSQYKTAAPSGWHTIGLASARYNLVQGFKRNNQADEHRQQSDENQTESEVAVIDGVWFCTTKKIAIQLPFDEQHLVGFHGYDIDFSLQVGQSYQVIVTQNVLLKHFSEGNFDQGWVTEMLAVHRKWHDKLPVNRGSFNAAQLRSAEKKTLRAFVKKAVDTGIAKREILAVLSKQKLLRILGWPTVVLLMLILLVRPVKGR
ncbi:glycosyltransferase [Pedobacter sp. SYP-B3415]|uniref:glycosyltransferase n=1 Tax=Pedobacter sp. SYP-B3415 TaxID=2496641 RepID=UPI00101C116F|nr:glycosyltransferase [Pedobacter sp. SYP-B3415]